MADGEPRKKIFGGSGDGGGTLSTGDYLLLANTLNLSIADMSELTVGMVLDLAMDKSGTGYRKAEQSDIDRFFGW